MTAPICARWSTGWGLALTDTFLTAGRALCCALLRGGASVEGAPRGSGCNRKNARVGKTMQDELSDNQKRAIRALLSTPSVRAAAAACSLAERTLHHYLADPAFTAALRAEQDKLTAASTAALVGGAGLARETLADVMTDKEASPSARVRAAVAWLGAWRDAVTLDDLTQRIEALEALL